VVLAPEGNLGGSIYIVVIFPACTALPISVMSATKPPPPVVVAVADVVVATVVVEGAIVATVGGAEATHGVYTLGSSCHTDDKVCLPPGSIPKCI
jgi:hypothetical protein